MRKNKAVYLFLTLFFILLIFSSSVLAEGKIGNFSARTIEGETITEEIFKKADLTMLNVWGTFCPPCLREMPELGKLAAELADEGVQIIGLVCDWTDKSGNGDKDQIEKASRLVQQTGAYYLHLLLDDSLQRYLGNIFAVPQTYFVDKNGAILAAVTGARSGRQWKDIIFQLLPYVQQ